MTHQDVRSGLLVLFLDPFDRPQLDLIPNQQYSVEQIGRIDVVGARTLVAVDIHAHVTFQPRVHSGEARFPFRPVPNVQQLDFTPEPSTITGGYIG